MIAATGLWLAEHTGDGRRDAAASAVIGLTLLAVAVVLALENYSLLLGETAPTRVERTIREVMEAEHAALNVTALHTMHLGPNNIVMGAEHARGRGGCLAPPP